MSRDFLLVSLMSLSVASVLCTRPAAAASLPQCAPRTDFVRLLSDRLGEHRQTMGLARNGSVVETFAAEDGDWTILVTRPDGISCLLAMGSWFEGAQQIRPAGEPA